MSLAYNVEKSISERLQAPVIGANDIYELPNGRCFTEQDVLEQCVQLTQAIYPEEGDAQGRDATPFLAVDTDGFSSIVWIGSAVIADLRLYYTIDDATGAVLEMEIQGDDVLCSDNVDLTGTRQWNVRWDESEALLIRLANVLQENLQYDGVSIENIQDIEANEGASQFSCEFVFYDQERGESVHAVVSLPSRFYLIFNKDGKDGYSG